MAEGSDCQGKLECEEEFTADLSENETDVLLAEYKNLCQEARHRDSRNRALFYVSIVFISALIRELAPIFAGGEITLYHISLLSVGFSVFIILSVWAEISNGSTDHANKRIHCIESRLRCNYPDTFPDDASRTKLYSGILSQTPFAGKDSFNKFADIHFLPFLFSVIAASMLAGLLWII